MKIFRGFYLVALPIILIGLPFLFYIKISKPSVYTYNIVIYGDTISASMLAYYIDQQIQNSVKHSESIIKFNITLISPSEIMSNVPLKENFTEINKKMYSFCGVQRQFMKLVQNTNLKYNIKEYGIYFGEIIQGAEKNDFQIYTREAPFFNTFSKYGLSNYAANHFFTQFSKNVKNRNLIDRPKISHKLEEMTTFNIIKNSFPSSIQENGLKYFSQTLGLDLSYINSFIYPVIWGNYLHETNSLSAFYKLLSTYCHKKPDMGKSLVIFEEPKKIKEKILSMVSYLNINFIPNKIIQTYSLIKSSDPNRKKQINIALNSKQGVVQAEQEYIKLNDTLRTYINCDMLFIFQNTENIGVKTYSYYKTIIDGKIKNEDLYQQFFTIYMKVNAKRKQDSKAQQSKKDKIQVKPSTKSLGFNPIYSITRVCAVNCKGYENSVYILISKHRFINSRNLQMFQSHQTKYFKKFYIQKSQMPTNKKLQENQNVFKIYDIDSISDSFQVQLNFVKEISQSFIKKIKSQYIL